MAKEIQNNLKVGSLYTWNRVLKSNGNREVYIKILAIEGETVTCQNHFVENDGQFSKYPISIKAFNTRIKNKTIKPV